MENMEQMPDLEQLIREQPGPEVFQRVWARVMPDQGDSPLAVSAVPRQEEPGPVPPEASPEQKPCSVQEEVPSRAEAPVTPEVSVPPVCLGEASRGDVEALTALMELAQENLFAGQTLARRLNRGLRSRALDSLAADHRRAARQLSAARFLITGQRFRPERKRCSIPADLALALRDQFAREQRWSRACEQAAASAGDHCLRELYLELAQDGTLHAGEIRSLLERGAFTTG